MFDVLTVMNSYKLKAKGIALNSMNDEYTSSGSCSNSDDEVQCDDFDY